MYFKFEMHLRQKRHSLQSLEKIPICFYEVIMKTHERTSTSLAPLQSQSANIYKVDPKMTNRHINRPDRTKWHSSGWDNLYENLCTHLSPYTPDAPRLANKSMSFVEEPHSSQFVTIHGHVKPHTRPEVATID